MLTLADQMETINKLLKKQAPKVNKKAAAAAAAEEDGEDESTKVNPAIIRWVNSKDGSRIGLSQDLVDGPTGNVFKYGASLPQGKMVQEIA